MAKEGWGDRAAQKIVEMKNRTEALELVASCAKDIVEFWPNFSFRQVRNMCSKMDALKEALEMLAKNGQ